MSKTGYCSLCASEYAPKINKLIKDGSSYAKVSTAMDGKLSFAKGTFYSHKEHITHPLVTAADEARAHPIIDAPKSNTAVLEMIRDIGLRKIMDDPDSITPSQTIRAASILAEKESKHEGILVILAKEVMGPPKDIPLLEGEYKVLED